MRRSYPASRYAPTMQASRALAAAVVLALGGAAWFLWPMPAEEDRVRATIHAIVEGAEAGDLGQTTDPLAPSFVAESEGSTLDRQTLRALLAREFLRRGPIFVLVGEIQVSLEGNVATASFDAVLTENSEKLVDVLPVDVDAWHLDVELRKVDGAWSVTRATRSEPILIPTG